MKLFLLATYLLFIVIEIILNRMFRSKLKDKQETDKKSLLILWITISLSIFLASIIERNIELQVCRGSLVLYLGLVLLYLGIIIRLIAFYTLGKYFTVDVTIRNNHKLKKDGPF
jgi:protein-S-isoprenylcysteine O-methyltransferase Ste14